MKFLHVGDLHLGKTLGGFPLLEDQRVALWRLLDDAEAAGATVLVLAGDIYDSSQPSGQAVSLFGDFLKSVVARGIEVIAVPGNHDSPERVGYASELLFGEGIYVAEPFDGDVLTVEFDDEYGTVTFWLLPFLRPADVREAYRDPSVATDFTSAVGAVIERLPIDEGKRNVLVAHQFVTAAGEEPERSGSEMVWVGTAGNVDAGVFAPFDYVALGHLHKPQSVGRREVRYAGSLLKYSLSEASVPKEGELVELGAKAGPGECAVAIEPLPVRPVRDLREVAGTLEELTRPGAALEPGADDYLYVTLTDEVQPASAMPRLRESHPHAVAVILQGAADGAGDLDRVDFDMGALDPLELFGQFFEERNARPMNGAERALAQRALDEAFGMAGPGAPAPMGASETAPAGLAAAADGGEGA